MKKLDIERIIKDLISKFRPAPVSVGIDTGEGCTKAVLLRQELSGPVSLLAYLIVPHSPGDAKTNPLPLIKGLLKEKASPFADVKFVVSGSDVDSKRITLPSMPKEEIMQALKWEAKDHFLFNIEESMLDFEVLKEKTKEDGAKHIELIADAVQNKFVDEKLSLFKDDQLQVSVVTTAARALYNLYKLNPKSDSEEPIALIDIGASTATVVIVKNNKIRFVRQCGCAGRDITSAMLGTLVSGKGKIELSQEDAEKLKKEIGIPDESAQGPGEGISAMQINSMVRPVIEKLTTDIKRSLDYYASQFDEGRASRVFLSGGTSRLKNFSAQLFQRLSIPVEVLGIPEGLHLKLDVEKINAFRQDFALIAPAIGAALSSPEDVNLIPGSYKSEKIEKIEKISIRLVFIIISLMLLTAYIFDLGQGRVLQNLLSAKRPQWQKLQEIQSFHFKVGQKDNIINNAMSNQTPLFYVLKLLASLTPRAVYLEDLAIEEKASGLKMEGVVFETKDTAEVTLAGFIKSLEDAPFFSSVRLISSQDAEIMDKDALEFSISCKLQRHNR